MCKKLSYLILISLFVVLTASLPLPVGAQEGSYPLEKCEMGAFSVEEDFVMQEGEAYDGDPYVSDGDVLSTDGVVCARNADLLAAFYPEQRAPDLGLDALDMLNMADRLVAFSIELDDPRGRFTAGDLLFTPGYAIPNVALMAAFDVQHDVGLDAVQFVGETDRILKFVGTLPNTPRDAFLRNPTLLRELLAEYEIDIWFSIEGTVGPADAPSILDGDLLSAASGVKVAGNDLLLQASVPAGIPNRGVDFGLDAAMSLRFTDPESARAALQFSTEILYEGADFSFTDGDILRIGAGVVNTNDFLIAKFFPAADFLGLDALDAAQPRELPEPEPMITLIGNKSVWDIDGGFVPIAGGGTGLFQEDLSLGTPTLPRQPFGWYIPIDGYLSDDITEFRVAFRAATDPVPAPGAAPAIQTTWTVYEWYGTAPHCQPTGTFADTGGWFDKADYDFYRTGVGGCPNPGLVMAVWDTLNDPNVTDKDGHYVIWLEYRTTGGGATIFREPVDHHVQLDNTAPLINGLELRTPDGTVVEPCGGAAAGTDVLHVYADFYDEYISGYRLQIKGGNPPAAQNYGWHNHGDGTPEVANIYEKGTTPAGLKFLRTVDMNDLGASYTECCYVLNLWVSDAGIRHNFNHMMAWPQQPGWAWPNEFLTFAAAP